MTRFNWRFGTALGALLSLGSAHAGVFGVGATLVAREVAVQTTASQIEDALQPPTPAAVPPGSTAATPGPGATPSVSEEAETPPPAKPSEVRPRPAIVPPRPFQVGKDNLAFSNPTGAISIEGMGGNCYTMAVVARLFYEAGAFRADGSPGFEPQDIARTLRSPRYPEPRFSVGGADLFSLSTPPEGVDSERWMEQWTRYQVGIESEKPAGPEPANAESLAKLYQLITTVHYLHYVQYQAESLISSALKSSLAGSKAPKRVIEETLASIKTMLPAGRLPVMAMFSPRPDVFYGHAVLVYKLVEHADQSGTLAYTDLYLYDSNVQYKDGARNAGDDRNESVLRVKPDGSYTYHSRSAATGELTPNPMYDAAAWFNDRDSAVLLVFEELNRQVDLREKLASKLSVADEAAAYLLAGGDLLKQVTTESPRESTFQENIRDFVLATQGINDKLGARPAWRTSNLSERAGVEELNRHLERYTERTLEVIYPRAFPEGLHLTGTKLAFKPEDPNTATLETTIRLEKSRDIQKIIEGLSKSALFGDQAALRDLIQGVSHAFEGEEVLVSVRLDLTKKLTPAAFANKIGKYMPVPRLNASLVVIGKLSPSGAKLTDKTHRIEVSEAVVAKFVRQQLKEAGVIGKRMTTRYTVGGWARTGRLDINDVTVPMAGPDGESPTGWIGLRVDYDGWMAVATQSQGAGVESGEATLWMRLRTTGDRNHVRLSGVLSGSHKVELGFFDWIDRLIAGAVGNFFEDVFENIEDALDPFIEEQLSQYVELEGAAPKLRELSVSGTSVSLDLSAFDVDVEKSLRNVLGLSEAQTGRLPVRLKDIRFLKDRAVVEITEER